MREDPFKKFGEWFAAAEGSEPSDPNAMALATTGENGRPSARILLMKSWDSNGFSFYGNLGSRKARELRQNPQAALLFHWKSLARQVRIEGRASQVSDAQADAYFATRPRMSQIGAWASEQSRPLPSRAAFEARLAEMEARFTGQPVPRPPFWSGWTLAPDYFEFWQGVDFRLHERFIFTKTAAGWETGWLYP
jgi:pyridoxamine 5'-phosphate oxidase